MRPVRLYESQACARGAHEQCVRYWCTCPHHGPLREGDLARETAYHEWHRPAEYPDDCELCSREQISGERVRPPSPPPWWLRAWRRVQAVWWADRR
jgi:hypothetical protein